MMAPQVIAAKSGKKRSRLPARPKADREANIVAPARPVIPGGRSFASLSPDGRTLTVRVPLSLTQHGGRKLVVTPDGSDWHPSPARIDNAMVKAIARAFRWRKLIETGVFVTIEELAAKEKINASYVSRVLRLTLLAPEIVEAVLDGRQAIRLHLDDLLTKFSSDWRDQLALLSTGNCGELNSRSGCRGA